MPQPKIVEVRPKIETAEEFKARHKRILVNRAYYKQLTDNDPGARARVLQCCQRDVVFWVNHFVWCQEPREAVEFPMVLFDYQAWALRHWKEHLDYNKGDMVIEKARDMGITWIILFLFIHYWLFSANQNFLISSYREDEVDIPSSMATLFPKMRYAIDMLPAWMKPKGYNPKIHATYQRIYNPENKSMIKGSAPIANFGRSGRYKALLYDEHPQWAFGRLAWDAASRTTENRITLGTPFGRDNMYAELALDANNTRILYPGYQSY